MRDFQWVTVGKILEVLEDEGCKISRPTFMKLMKEDHLFMMNKSSGGWYVCNETEAALIVELIKQNYGLS